MMITSSFVRTGHAALDDELGGGYPTGCLVEIFGPTESGKSALAFQAIAAQPLDRIAAVVDSKGSFVPFIARQLGAVGRYTVLESRVPDELLRIVRVLAAVRTPLVVLDPTSWIDNRIVGELGAIAASAPSTCFLLLTTTVPGFPTPPSMRSLGYMAATKIETSKAGALPTAQVRKNKRTGGVAGKVVPLKVWPWGGKS